MSQIIEKSSNVQDFTHEIRSDEKHNSRKYEIMI